MADGTVLSLKRKYQATPWTCGAVCTDMIASYFGRREDPVSIAVELQIHTKGNSSRWDIRDFFKRRGFAADLLGDAKLKDLQRSVQAGGPLVCMVKNATHWVIVHGICLDRCHVWVADPLAEVAGGMPGLVARKDFKQVWDRVAISVKPPANRR